MRKLFLSFILAASCRADVIFSNLGSFDTGNSSGLSVANQGFNQVAAAAFTPTANYTVVDAEVVMGTAVGAPVIHASIFSDSAGLPGVNLAALGNLTILSPTQLYTTGDPQPALSVDAGVQYWLVLLPTGLANTAWSYTGIHSVPTSISNDVTGAQGWKLTDESFNLQFAINGTPVAVIASPEPATLALLGLGLLGAVLWRQTLCRRSSPEF